VRPRRPGSPRLRHPRLRILIATALLAAAANLARAAEPVELRISAAASLRDVLEELAPALERATGARLVLNLGASGDLARQIVAAPRSDLFFSADEAGLVDAGSRRSPLSNRLVVVVALDSLLELRRVEDLALPGVRRLSIAHPEVVPAGKYAKAWLESHGLWDDVERRVVPALDVRAALAAIESGAIEAGIVYRTDAATSRRVRVAFEVAAADGPPISYALAAIAERPQLARSRAAAAWLAGPEAAAIFERHGFVSRGDAP
jgi:molybdate transport system substrate-binding protein